jgi:predicted nucleic acid-binding protein
MIVLDCSAAVAIAFGTDEGLGLRQLFLEGEAVAAPDLLHAELAHALVKYARAGIIEPAAMFAYRARVLELVDETVDMGELDTEAMQVALDDGMSSYDMYYYALARRRAATLATLDKKLIAYCEATGVDCIHEVSLA